MRRKSVKHELLIRVKSIEGIVFAFQVSFMHKEILPSVYVYYVEKSTTNGVDSERFLSQADWFDHISLSSYRFFDHFCHIVIGIRNVQEMRFRKIQGR